MPKLHHHETEECIYGCSCLCVLPDVANVTGAVVRWFVLCLYDKVKIFKFI